MDKLPPSVVAFFPNAKPVWANAPNPSPLTHIDQLSIVVEDVYAAIEYFGAAFGWGPFYIGEASRALPYKGELSEINLRLAFTLVGELEIELLQPLSGNSPHLDHLRRRGEGLMHIRFATGDVQGALDHLASLNITPTLLYTHQETILNAYVDSDQQFGVRAEVILNANELRKLNLGTTYSR